MSLVLFGLATLIAACNLIGGVAAVRRQRRGDSRGYSAIPLFSIPLSVGAYLAGPEPLGLFALAPAALDPATWSLLSMPFFLIAERRRGRGDSGS